MHIETMPTDEAEYVAVTKSLTPGATFTSQPEMERLFLDAIESGDIIRVGTQPVTGKVLYRRAL